MGIRIHTNVSSIHAARHRHARDAAPDAHREDLSSGSHIHDTGENALRSKFDHHTSENLTPEGPLQNASLALHILVGITNASSSSVDLTQDTNNDGNALDPDAGINNAFNAGPAMDDLKSAMEKDLDLRSNFGTLPKDNETSISNNRMTSKGNFGANSRIRDVDVASETSGLTSSQIQHQKGVSILASSNLSASLAMKLLK